MAWLTYNSDDEEPNNLTIAREREREKKNEETKEEEILERRRRRDCGEDDPSCVTVKQICEEFVVALSSFGKVKYRNKNRDEKTTTMMIWFS